LQPAIVTIHLLLGMTLLAMLAWLAANRSNHLPVAPEAARLLLPAALAAILLAILIALGGWVSSNYAALACPDFPLCAGSVWPPMDFANGFTLWRDLGMTAEGELLSFPALRAIHWTHRAFAYLAIAFLAWLALKAHSVAGLKKTARWLLIMLALQFASGVANLFLGLPLALAVAHNAGAALLVLLVTMLNFKVRLAGRASRQVLLEEGYRA